MLVDLKNWSNTTLIIFLRKKLQQWLDFSFWPRIISGQFPESGQSCKHLLLSAQSNTLNYAMKTKSYKKLLHIYFLMHITVFLAHQSIDMTKYYLSSQLMPWMVLFFTTQRANQSHLNFSHIKSPICVIITLSV